MRPCSHRSSCHWLPTGSWNQTLLTSLTHRQLTWVQAHAGVPFQQATEAGTRAHHDAAAAAAVENTPDPGAEARSGLLNGSDRHGGGLAAGNSGSGAAFCASASGSASGGCVGTPLVGLLDPAGLSLRGAGSTPSLANVRLGAYGLSRQPGFVPD